MTKTKAFGVVALSLITVALAAGPLLADGGAQHQVKQTAPVKMGTSGGSLNDASRLYCCGGTLGSLVSRDGVTCILSNNHILARSGSAAVGEDTIQPGLIDVGCRANGTNSNTVGDFLGDIVPLGTANVDVGLSTARAGMVDTTGAILDVGVPCSATQNPTLGLQVTKSGRTTGQTFGQVQALNTSVNIQYQKGCNSGKKFVISYTNQVSITAVAPSSTFSAGGDSGSLIVSNDGTPNPTALLYAGNSTTTIGNPIQDVVSAFTAGGHTFSFLGAACGGAAAATSLNQASSQANRPSDSDLDFARTMKERFEPDLFARPGVIGVGVGATVDGGTEAAIIVYVDAPKGSHPQGFPSELNGVKVRVIPTEPFVAF